MGLVVGLLGLTWGFNSVNEKSSLKSTGTTLMKVFSSLFLLVLIAPTSVVIDKVEGTVVKYSTGVEDLFACSFAGLILVSYFIRTKLASQEVSKDYLNIWLCWLLVVSIWLIKVPTVTFDSSNVRINLTSFASRSFNKKSMDSSIPTTSSYIFIGRYLNSKI